MKKKTQKGIPTVEELNSEAERSALETQIKEFVKQPTQALATQPDVRLDKIKTKQGGERIAARARNGKFISSVEATTIVRTKRTSKFLEELDSETGKSRHQTLLEAGYKGALVAAAEPTGRSLGNYVKTMEMYDEQSGNRAAREAAIAEANREVNAPMTVVINMPVLLHPEIQDGDKPRETPKKPSFADSEVIQQDGPSGMPR